MFEHFTEAARQAVLLAQDEARALKQREIGTEHMLLGLLRAEACLGARVLESFEIEIDENRAAVVRITGEGDEVVRGQIPFTAEAKNAFELAATESIELGHPHRHRAPGCSALRARQGGRAHPARARRRCRQPPRTDCARMISRRDRPPGPARVEPTVGRRLPLDRTAAGVLDLAQSEAHSLKQNYVGTEHILLALLRERQGFTVRLLAVLGLTYGDARTQLVEGGLMGDEPTNGRQPVTPSAQRVLEAAHGEAFALGADQVGSQHILLALISRDTGVAASIIRDARL